MQPGKALIGNRDFDAARIRTLENFLAIELQRAAELLKENQRLEAELEQAIKKAVYWQKRYESSAAVVNKIFCDREEAMAVSALPSTPEPGE